MGEYEIHILQSEGSPSIITAEIHFSDESAIRSARKMAHGRQFEVWRGLECITGLATMPQPTVALPASLQ